MSSFKIFDIAGSGMSAQSVRLNTTASNLANADSVSGDPAQMAESPDEYAGLFAAFLGELAALAPDAIEVRRETADGRGAGRSSVGNIVNA